MSQELDAMVRIVIGSLAFEPVHPEKDEALEIATIPTGSGNLDVAKLFAGRVYRPHLHETVDAKLHVLAGEGIANIDGRRFSYSPGTTIDVPRGTPHGFAVETETYLLSIQSRPIQDPKTGELDFSHDPQNH